MKNYPLWKSILVISIIISGIFFSIPSFIYNENSDNWFLKNKINLGLDLQGGSYLLIEVESEVLISEELENISDLVRRFSRDLKTKVLKSNLKDDEISFQFIDDNNLKELRNKLLESYQNINIVIKDNFLNIIINNNFKKKDTRISY